MMPMTPLMQIWRAMERIAHEGGARQIGVCNCYDLALLRRLYDDAEIKPSVVQNRFYGESGYDVAIRAFCDETGMRYQSFWSLTANPHIVKSELVSTLAMQYGKSQEQLFYRFLMQQSITPLNGTTSISHMQEDLDISDFLLTQDELASIAGLLT